MNMHNFFLTILFLITATSSLQPNFWTFLGNVSNPTFNTLLELNPLSLGIDAQGNAFVVWNSQESGNVIKASRFDRASQTWSAEEIIGSDNANIPQIAVTTDGKAVALWVRSETIYANFYDGSSWGSEQIIDTDPSFQVQGQPQVGVDAAGNAIAVWEVAGNSVARVIRAAIGDITAGTWAAAENISTDYGYDYDDFAILRVGQPQIALNAAGNAIVVWRYADEENNVYKIQSNLYIDGSWLSAEEDIQTSLSNTAQLVLPSVAFDTNNHALVTWVQFDGTFANNQPYAIYASSRNTGWSTSVRVSSTLGFYNFNNSFAAEKGPYFSHVAIDGNGDAIGVWALRHATCNISYIEASTFPGLAWSGNTSVISDMSLISFFPQVSIDLAGNAFAIWMAQNSSNTQFIVQTSFYNKSLNTWQTTPETISTGDFNGLPNIATNGTGSFFADWFHSDDMTNFIVQAARTIYFNFSLSKQVMNISFTIAISNSGSDTATDLMIADVLPSALTYVSSSASQGTYDAISGLWEVGDLAGFSNATLTITAQLDASTPVEIVNMATLLDVYGENTAQVTVSIS